MFHNFFFEKSCRLWDNVQKMRHSRQATDGNITGHTRFECWIPKAIYTLSEYVILIAFTRQKWAPQCYVTRTLPVLFPENKNSSWITTIVQLTHWLIMAVNHTEIIIDNTICGKLTKWCHFKWILNNYVTDVHLIRLKVEWVWPACNCKWSSSP
jgi:hypothetical protein